MAAEQSLNLANLLREHLKLASPDLLREMVKTFADLLMSAKGDAICGAEYGERSAERTNSRNGYRAREWHTGGGTVELAIPKLRSGGYFPDWLLQHRRRAEQDARAFCDEFFTAYNHERRDSGIGWHTPASEHYGTTDQIHRHRQSTLDKAYTTHPDRVTRRPRAPPLPEKAGINQPAPQPQTVSIRLDNYRPA